MSAAAGTHLTAPRAERADTVTSPQTREATRRDLLVARVYLVLTLVLAAVVAAAVVAATLA